jgi:hypothetical protein
MKESDQLATSFITPFRMYCYVMMPFGLRNAGATYQRCMQHVFGDHIGRTIEAYVDDIVVKTRKADDLVNDLNIAFGCLRGNGVKLNPEKCVFGVPRGMLLGYIVSQRDIEANPEKVAALERMGPIRDLKGGPKGAGMPCRPEPLRLAARREGLAPLPAPQKERAFLLDRQGPGGA